jgi:hypothetical protein
MEKTPNSSAPTLKLVNGPAGRENPLMITDCTLVLTRDEQPRSSNYSKIERLLYDTRFSLHTIYCICIHYTTNPYSTPTAIMHLRCCIVCKVEGSPDLQLQYCAACLSALYCSKACQKEDWKKQHKQICKLLNVGNGDMQVRIDEHSSRSIDQKEQFERKERSLNEGVKLFFKLFQESTFEGSQAASRQMREIAERQIEHTQTFLMFFSLLFLIRTSNSEKLSWPNSPLLVLLQFVGPSVLSGGEHQEGRVKLTPLHHLANLADPSDYSTHENQLILAKQLIEHGANVNAVSIPKGATPLHYACNECNVTNLDFVHLLLTKGADPNALNEFGRTPLLCAVPYAPGAAKFLLNWPATDVNIATPSGASFLVYVRRAVKFFFDQVARPNNREQIQDQFLLQQWRDIDEMLVETGAYAQIDVVENEIEDLENTLLDQARAAAELSSPSSTAVIAAAANLSTPASSTSTSTSTSTGTSTANDATVAAGLSALTITATGNLSAAVAAATTATSATTPSTDHYTSSDGGTDDPSSGGGGGGGTDLENTLLDQARAAATGDNH